MVNTGRRARNRALRHQQLIEAAGAILAVKGIDGLTMQEVADRVDCAVGTIYTYFASKSALLAALQSQAIRVLSDSHEAAASAWDDGLEHQGVAPDIAALARMLALARLIMAWPDLQPREWAFLQMLIATQDQVIATEDALSVVPQALVLFSEARVLIDGAVAEGVLREDPDRPGDDSLSRTVRWIAAVDGAIMVAQAASLVVELDPDAFDRRRIGENATVDMLLAWGAPRETIHEACEAVGALEAGGHLLPPTQGGGR